MPNYEIVDWLFDQLDDEDFKSTSSLKERIKNLDSKDVLGGFLSSNWDEKTNRGKNSSQRTLGEHVDTVNTDYETEVMVQIERANTESELNAVKIDESYNISSELEEAKEAKMEELQQPVFIDVAGKSIEVGEGAFGGKGRPTDAAKQIAEAEAGEIIAEITAAQAATDIDALKSISIPKSVKAIEDTLQDILDDSIESVEGILEAQQIIEEDKLNEEE